MKNQQQKLFKMKNIKKKPYKNGKNINEPQDFSWLSISVVRAPRGEEAKE